jgi:hypothetical protein
VQGRGDRRKGVGEQVKGLFVWLVNIFAWLLKSSKSATDATESTTSDKTTAETSDQVLVLTHPEEAKDDNATVENTDIYEVMTEWLRQWSVPSEYWTHWREAIVVQLYDVWPSEMLATGIKADTPACTWESGGKRHLASLAKWFNPGVIAHEQAHNSYALLTAKQKAEFSAAYTSLKDTDPLIKYLYSINSYGLTSDIEGHAEVYRYIGDKMPEQLKKYYPKFF